MHAFTAAGIPFTSMILLAREAWTVSEIMRVLQYGPGCISSNSPCMICCTATIYLLWERVHLPGMCPCTAPQPIWTHFGLEIQAVKQLRVCLNYNAIDRLPDWHVTQCWTTNPFSQHTFISKDGLLVQSPKGNTPLINFFDPRWTTFIKSGNKMTAPWLHILHSGRDFCKDAQHRAGARTHLPVPSPTSSLQSRPVLCCSAAQHRSVGLRLEQDPIPDQEERRWGEKREGGKYLKKKEKKKKQKTPPWDYHLLFN